MCDLRFELQSCQRDLRIVQSSPDRRKMIGSTSNNMLVNRSYKSCLIGGGDV